MNSWTKYWIVATVAVLAFILRPSTEKISLSKVIQVDKRKAFDTLKDPYGFLQLHPYAVEVKILDHQISADSDSVTFDVTETIDIGNTSAQITLSNDRKSKITLKSSSAYNIIKVLITWELSDSKNKGTLIQENFTITAPWIARSKVTKLIKDAHIQMLKKLESLDTAIFEQ